MLRNLEPGGNPQLRLLAASLGSCMLPNWPAPTCDLVGQGGQVCTTAVQAQLASRHLAGVFITTTSCSWLCRHTTMAASPLGSRQPPARLWRTCATASACQASWMSVMMGTLKVSFTTLRMLRAGWGRGRGEWGRGRGGRGGVLGEQPGEEGGERPAAQGGFQLFFNVEKEFNCCEGDIARHGRAGGDG